jgi:hypothetical protein
LLLKPKKKTQTKVSFQPHNFQIPTSLSLELELETASPSEAPCRRDPFAVSENELKL